MKYDSQKVRLFKEIFDLATIFVVNIVAVLCFVLSFNAISDEMLNDHVMTNKILNIEDSYDDNYQKAVELDNVIITKDEDIKVTVKTKNYVLITRFNSDGNYISSDLSPRLGAKWLTVICCWLLSGAATWFILYFVRDFIAAIIDKVDEKNAKKKADEELKIAKAKEAKQELEEIEKE